MSDDPRLHWVRIQKSPYLDVVLNGSPHRIQQYRIVDEASGAKDWIDVDIIEAPGGGWARIAAIAIIALLTFIALQSSAMAKSSARSGREVREFKYYNPCPSTGQRYGSCPGYVVDHVDPLCAGGADKRWNMQWQAIEESRVKDVRERAYCACLKGGGATCRKP